MDKIEVFIDIEGSGAIQQLAGIIVHKGEVLEIFDLINPSFINDSTRRGNRFVEHKYSKIVNGGDKEIRTRFNKIINKYNVERVWIGQSIKNDYNKISNEIINKDLDKFCDLQLIKERGTLSEKAEESLNYENINKILGDILDYDARFTLKEFGPHNALYDCVMGVLLYSESNIDFEFPGVLGLSKIEELRVNLSDKFNILPSKLERSISSDMIYLYNNSCPYRRDYIIRSLLNKDNSISETISLLKLINFSRNVIPGIGSKYIARINFYDYYRYESLEDFSKYLNKEAIYKQRDLNSNYVNIIDFKSEINNFKIDYKTIESIMQFTKDNVNNSLTQSYWNMPIKILEYILISNKDNIISIDFDRWTNNLNSIIDSVIYVTREDLSESLILSMLADNNIITLNEEKLEIKISTKGEPDKIIVTPMDIGRIMYLVHQEMNLIENKVDIIEYKKQIENLVIYNRDIYKIERI